MQALAELAAIESFDKAAHSLVKNLHTPNRAIFWTDLFATSAVAWSLFAIAAMSSSLWVTGVCTVGFAFAIYRALGFIHEISHIRRALLPGFEFVWNLVAGVPLLMPSFVYCGVHQDHHSPATYGTERDPEYMPFSTSRVMIVAFVVQSVLIPAFLLIRFLLLSVIGLLLPPVQRWLAVHASSLTMNIQYSRPVKDSTLSTMRAWQLYILAFWGGALFLMTTGRASWRLLAVWYAGTAIASLVNTLRTLGAHHYETEGEPRPRLAQLRDSIDTPGRWWTELWAPVGLRYHAMHHYFPGIPYHNLGEAYRRLVAHHASYTEMTSGSLAASLGSLYERAGRS